MDAQTQTENTSTAQEENKSYCLNKGSLLIPNEKQNSCLNNNSIIPAIQESERFIQFLNNRFELNLSNNILVTISKAHKNTIGYFMPKNNPNHFINTTQTLNNINLNTLYLKKHNPYEVLAHETAHFINAVKGIKDCSVNQYHNKHFKETAEKLLLSVEKNNHGYADTTPTAEFLIMVENEFKPNPIAFIIEQANEDKIKKGSRLKKYICNCGCIIRTAKNEYKPLNADCLYCNSKFSEVLE